MDPLSVTASIVAIVGAGGSLASGLRKIYALKDAPDDLRQLYEELSEIRLLVSAIQEACRQRGNRVPVEDECDEFIYVTLKRSRDEVLGVEKLIAYDLTKVTSNGDELNKMAWMRARSQVQSAQARLRDTRSRLTGILNVSLVRHLHVQSASIHVNIEEFGRRQDMAEELIRRNQDTREQQIHEVSQSHEQTSLMTTNSIVAGSGSVLELRSRLFASSSPSESFSTSIIPRDKVVTKTSQRRSSLSGCSCSCHRWNRLRSPQLLHSVLGSLVVIYDSLPFLAQICDDIACRNHATMSFTASYAFPQWFTNRIIAVRATSEPKKGPELLLRVLTVRPWHAQIFYAVLHGRIDTIKRLFEKGEASVYDVSDHGGSLLTNAIRQGCVSEDTILFLINAGADTEQEDQRQCSPYVLWWSNRLTSRSPTPHSRLELFGAIPEPGDLGLQDLHASVLGLGTKAFDLVLRNTPRSKVNEPDRIGRTALHLAAQLGNVSMVEGLLMKGADPNLEDHIGYMPLGLWADQNPMQNCSHEQFEGVCGHMLDLLGTQEAVNHVNCYGSLVSHHVLFFDAGIIAALEKLKSLGADFAENGDTEHSLISQAVMSNKNVSHVIPWLLANGCDISRPSLSHGTTPTMTAVIYTRHEALELLLHRGSDYALLNNDQGSILHLAAAGADQKILEVLCQHSLERLSLDAKRSDGWTPIKLARWRRDNNIEWSELVLRAPDEDPLQWYDAFKALYRHIAESQGLAYPEELDEERITEAIEGEVGNDLVVTLNEGEAAPQLQMPGSYPDN